MKKLLYLLIFLLPIAACKKAGNVRHLLITASTDAAGAVLEIGGTEYVLTGTKLEKEILLEEDGSVTVDLTSSGNRYVHLYLSEDSISAEETSGYGYAWMVISNTKINTNRNSAGNGGTGNTGYWCAKVLCSATASTGMQCNRLTTNCNGRCSKHW